MRCMPGASHIVPGPLVVVGRELELAGSERRHGAARCHSAGRTTPRRAESRRNTLSSILPCFLSATSFSKMSSSRARAGAIVLLRRLFQRLLLAFNGLSPYLYREYHDSFPARLRRQAVPGRRNNSVRTEAPGCHRFGRLRCQTPGSAPTDVRSRRSTIDGGQRHRQKPNEPNGGGKCCKIKCCPWIPPVQHRHCPSRQPAPTTPPATRSPPQRSSSALT